MIVVPAAVACVVSFFAIVAVRPVLARMGVVDAPNERSSHSVETLRGAGVGPLAGIVVALLILLPMTSDPLSVFGVSVVLAVSALCGILGLVEDVRGVPISVRIVCELLIGTACSVLVVVCFDGAWWWMPIGAVTVAGYINVANFMDGVNGISGLHAIVVGAAYATIAVIFDLGWAAAVSVVVAAAFAGFLPLNLARGAVFLGDTGSYLLGGALSTIALCALVAGVPPVAVLGPVAIYLADTGFTLTRRVLRGERWFDAHRQHVYQRLTDRGLSHVTVAVYVAVFSVVTTSLGMLSVAGVGWAWVGVVGIVVVSLLYLASPVLVGRRGLKEPTSEVIAVDLLPVGWMTDRVAARRWAVVGATGFVGRNLVNALRTAGADVIEVRAPRLSLPPVARAADVVAAARQSQSDQAVEQLAAQLYGRDVVINAAGLAAPDSPDSPDLFGANSLLPLIVAEAADRASVSRYVHLSSAAVQGNPRVIDETERVAPFSPYSLSKALGEQALAEWRSVRNPSTSIVTVRATSVQGLGRNTTARLQRVAKMPIASVAAPGDQKTPVSSVGALVAFLEFVGSFDGDVPHVVLQPWEGMTTQLVLESASGRKPVILPASLCKTAVALGYVLARLARGRLSGPVRRVELMWFGQSQADGWAEKTGVVFPRLVAEVLGGAVREMARPSVANRHQKLSSSDDLSIDDTNGAK